MPELPDHLDMSVALGGQPLKGAWVEVRLPMERKNDYVLMVGPTDAAGVLALSRADLESQIQFVQLSGFMEYSSLGVWRGELVLTPFDPEAIRRGQERYRVWDSNLLKAYPEDFLGQMESLAQHLADHPGLGLELTATARGGNAHLTVTSAAA